MRRSTIEEESRRHLKKFLADSPLLSGPGHSGFAAEGSGPRVNYLDPIAWARLNSDALIGSPRVAINVFDFEPVCRKNNAARGAPVSVQLYVSPD
jgi:4-hydroxymandelate oxidase